MAGSYSTLLISLAGLQVQNLQEVVNARGIDRVLVVDTVSGFNSSSGIAAVSGASSLRSGKSSESGQPPSFSFAFADAQGDVILNSTIYKALASSGFTFISDPTLTSFTNTFTLDQQYLIDKNASIDSGSASLASDLLDNFNPAVPISIFNGLGDFDGLSFTASTSFASTVIDPDSSFRSTSILSDFNGTAKVKLSALEFTDLVRRSNLPGSNLDRVVIDVKNPANIVVDNTNAADQKYLPLKIPSSIASINPSNNVPLSSTSETVLPITGAYLAKLASTTTKQADFSPSSNSSLNVYYLTAEKLVLSAQQLLSLPDEGVVMYAGASITLSDTSFNISQLLPLLTNSQLSSISSIKALDVGPILISPSDFIRLDNTTKLVSWSDYSGIVSFLGSDNNTAKIQLTGYLDDFQASSLLSIKGGLQSSTTLSGLDLVKQVSSLEIILPLATSTFNDLSANLNQLNLLKQGLSSSQSFVVRVIPPADYSVDLFKALKDPAAAIINDLPDTFVIADTQANLAELFKLSIDLSTIKSIRVTDTPGLPFELSYDQFKSLEERGLDVNLFDLQFEVIGTASELQRIIDAYGANLSSLFNVSFRVIDGGELALSSSQLDLLDGRIYASVVVVDTELNLANVFDDSIPDVVKSFKLIDKSGFIVDIDTDGSLHGDKITLTVNALAGLPSYLDANVFLRDTDENLERRLRSDLDYRVSRIEVSGTASGNSETALNLRIGQLERLLENGVEIVPGLAIVLDPRDTLEVNAKGAAVLPNGFQGSLVIADDGDALRSLFDDIWMIPAGATDVRLRSLDNAPLRLNVEQLEQLVGSYPGFSGAIQLVDVQSVLEAYIDLNPANIDSRVVDIAVLDLPLPLPMGAGGDRLELTAAQLDQLRLVEAGLGGIQLFNGTITLDDSSMSSTTPLPPDSRLELTAPQVSAKLQALLNSVNDQIRPDLNALKDSILNTTPNDGASSVIERLNELAAQVTKLDLETVTVAEFRTLVAAAGTPISQKFTIADNVSALRSLLSPQDPTLLQRIARLIPTEAADAALHLSFAQLYLLPPAVQVENLVVIDSNLELLNRLKNSVTPNTFDIDPRVDAIRLAAPAGRQAELLELSVAQYQAIANRIPEGRFELVDTDAALLTQLRSDADPRVVAIRPTDGVLSVSSLADLALLPEVIGSIAFTTTSQDLAALVRSPGFDPDRFSLLASSDRLPLIVDAEILALLPAGLATPKGLVLRDSAGDVAEVLSGALDPRLVGIESRSGELVLNVSQLQRLETLTSNLKVALRDDAVAIETYLAAGVPSVLISAISVSNGDRLSLSSESFANLITLEAIGGGNRVYAGQIELAAGSGDVDFVPAQLADLRVSSLSVQGSDQLVLSVAELERLGAGFSGKVILEDGLEAIRTLLGGDLDGRVNGIRAIDLDTNALVPLQLNADQLFHLPVALQAAVTVVENSAGIAQLLATPQSSSFKLLVPAGGLNLSAEQFVNLGSAQLVNAQGAATTVVVRDTAEDLAGLIDIDPNRPLDSRIAALQPTNSDRLSLSLAQVANLTVRITTPIVVADSADKLLARLTPAGGTGLDARIKGFDLINGTEITLSGAQFKSLQAVESRLGHQLLSGPFKLRGLTGEEAVLADILDDLDSRVEVVSSPAIRRLTLTSSQLRELGDGFSGEVILRDNAGGIVNELIRGLDVRVIRVETVGISELTLDARQLLSLPSDFAGKVILDDSLANIRSIITQPYSLPATRTLQLSIDQLAELTQLTAENSLLTGEGRLVVTAVRPGLGGVRTSDGLRNVNDALKTLPSSFKALTVQVEGALDLSAAGGEAILGLLVDQAKRRDATLYSEDLLVVAADSSLSLSSAQLIANDLQQLVKAGAVTAGSSAVHPQLLLTDVTGAQDLSMLDAALKVTANFGSNQTIDAAKLTRVDAISFGSNTLTLNAASADQLQIRFVDSASGHLEITGYSGEHVISLNTKAASIDLNVAGVQSISAAAAPAKATLTITGTALVDAADAVALKSRLVNGNPSGGNPGEVRVLGYTNQDLTVALGADLSRSKPEGLKLTVQVSAAADISTIDNRLADADEINIAAGGSLTLSTAQALGSSLLAARIQGVTGGSLTITGYNGENLGNIAPAAGDLAINFVLSNGGDLRTIPVADLLARTADADSLTIPQGKTLQLTAEQTLALKAKLSGDGVLEIANYAGQDLSVASGFGNLQVNVDVGSAAVDLTTSVLANALRDVDQIRLSANDQLTITEAQAVALANRFVATAASGSEASAQITVKGYQGADLSAFVDNQQANINIKLLVEQSLNLSTRLPATVQNQLSDVDRIEVVAPAQGSPARLTLSAYQAVLLASKLQGNGQLEINGYSTQNLSTLAGSLSTTLTLPANAAVTTDQSKLFASNAGVYQVQLADTATLTLNGYTGLNLASLITKDAGAILNVNIDRPAATSDIYKVDLSTTTNGGSAYLAPASSINIGANTELKINAGNGNTTFNDVAPKLTATSQGLLHVADVTSATPLAALKTNVPNLSVDVTLMGGTQTDFVNGLGQLEYVGNIFLPASSTLAIRFDQAVTGPGRQLYQFIQPLQGEGSGELRLDMNTFNITSNRDVGLTSLLAAQSAGKFKLSLDIPETVSLNLNASDLALFHTKLTGSGQLTVNNYNGQDIRGVSPALKSLEINTAAGVSVNLAYDAYLPVLSSTTNKAALKIAQDSKLTYLESAVNASLSNLAKREISLAAGATFAVQADVADAFSYSAGLAINPTSTIQLVGFDGTETITKVNGTNAKLHAVVGQAASTNQTGALVPGAAETINLANVAQVSALTLGGAYEVGDVVNAVVNGATVSVTAASANLSEIASQLAAALSANSTVATAVTTSVSGGVVTLTARTAGTAFTATATETNRSPVAQVSALTLSGSYEVGDVVSAVVNNTTVSVTAESEILSAIASQLAAALTANATVAAAVTASASAGVVTLTAKTPGTSFELTASAANGSSGADNTQAVTATTSAANITVGSNTTQAIAATTSTANINRLSAVDVVSVAVGSTLTLDSGLVLPAGLQFGFVGGSLTATAAQLTGKSIASSTASAVNLGSPGTITVKGIDLSADLDGIAAGYQLDAELTTSSANDLVFSVAELDTVDRFVITETGAFTATAAELNGRTVVPASGVTATINITGYTNQDLSLISGAFVLNVTTANNGASLIASKLTTVDTITVVGVSDILAADGLALVPTLSGNGSASLRITDTAAVPAASLNALNTKSGVVIDLNGVTQITGTADAVNAVYTAPSGSFSNAGAAAVSLDNNPTLAQLKEINTATNGTITLADYSLAISGSTDDVLAALGGTFAAPFTGAITLTTPATVTQANFIDAVTSGVITATISNVAIGELVTLTGTGNAYTIAVTTTSVDAADLNTLDGKTTVTVNANEVTTLTGTAAAIQTAITAASIDTAANVAVLVNSGTATVTQANAIEAVTEGVITATISNVAIGELVTLTGTGNAYTIAVTTTSVDAADLNTLDGKTTLTVNAAGVGTLTGTTAAIKQAITAAAIDTATNVVVTIGDVAATDLLATDLSAIGAATTGSVTVTNAVKVSGSASDLLAAVSASDTSVGLNAASTLIATSYAGENLSVISAAFDLKVSLAADTSVGNRNLSTADQLTVAAGKTLTLTSADDSTTNLTDLDRVILNGTGAKLVLDQASRLEAPSLTTIQGTSAGGETVLITTSASGAQSVNLKQISDITGVDSFAINADTNNSTLSVRLSEALSRSANVSVVLDPASTLSNYDTVFIESNISTATATSANPTDSTTTWAQLGLAGANISNFVSNVDSFGVVDSSGQTVFDSWQLGTAEGGSYVYDGALYLVTNKFYNIDKVSEVRSFIAASMIDSGTNVDSGFALLGRDSSGNIDIGIFHAKWIGSATANPAASSPELLLTRIAVLQDVSATATLGLTSVLAAPNFIANTVPTALA